MTLIKDDETTQFDELTGFAEETLEEFRDLAGSLDDADLRHVLQEQFDVQSELLRQLVERRRQAGALPQAGDPELGHLRAIIARIRSFVLPGGEQARMLESLVEAIEQLREELEQAQQWQLPEDQLQLLARYQHSCSVLAAALRENLAQQES